MSEQADAFIRDVAELPDRTSPEDAPEMMLVTAEELRSLIAKHFPRDQSQGGDWVLVPREPTQFVLFRIHEAIERLAGSINQPVAPEAYRAVVLHAAAPTAPQQAGPLTERIAHVLYECEKQRAENMESILTAANGGKQVTGTMEPFEENREMWIGDAEAVLKEIGR